MYDREELYYCLSLIDPDIERREWIEIAAAMQSEGFTVDDFTDWSSNGSKFKGKADCRAAWRSLHDMPRCDYRSLFSHAHRSGKFIPLKERDPQKWRSWREQEQRGGERGAGKLQARQTKLSRPATSKSKLPTFERGASPADKDRASSDEFRGQKRAAAAAGLVRLLAAALPARPDHPYLARKGVDTHGLLEINQSAACTQLGFHPKLNDRQLGGERWLIVPLHVGDGDISSAELINENGEKYSLPHLPRVGLIFSPSRLVDLAACPIIGIAEGMATAKTIVGIRGVPVLSAGSSANLTHVARTLRVECPAASIVVFGDRGGGESSAVAAAEAVYGWSAFPDAAALPPGGSDFNDLALHVGDDMAYAHLDAAIRDPRQVTFSGARERIPIDYVLPGLMLGTVGMIVGPGAIGKSFLAAELCASVTLGRSLSGSPLVQGVRPGKTAIVFGEDPKAIINNRFHDMISTYEITDDEITILDRDLLTISAVGEDISLLSLGNREVVFTRYILQLRVLCAGRRLVIIDPLSRLHSGDENDNMLASQLMTAIASIAMETSCSILVLHHFGKADRSDWSASRGASAFTTAARWQLNVSAPTKDEIDEIHLKAGPHVNAAKTIIRVALVKSNYGNGNQHWMQRTDRGVLRHVELDLGDDLAPITRPALTEIQRSPAVKPGNHPSSRSSRSDWSHLANLGLGGSASADTL
jgi:hypothetical protein